MGILPCTEELIYNRSTTKREREGGFLQILEQFSKQTELNIATHITQNGESIYAIHYAKDLRNNVESPSRF